MICPYCGKTIQDGLELCPLCGKETEFSARFSYVPSRTPISEPDSSDDHKKEKNEQQQNNFEKIEKRLAALEERLDRAKAEITNTSEKEVANRVKSFKIHEIIAAVTALVVCIACLWGAVSISRGLKQERVKAESERTAFMEKMEEMLQPVVAPEPTPDPTPEPTPEPTSEPRLYLNWNLPGGEDSPSQLLEAGATLQEPSLSPVGYRFKEWNTSADGKGKQYSGNKVSAAELPLTLYAVWEEIPPFENDGENSRSENNVNGGHGPANVPGNTGE